MIRIGVDIGGTKMEIAAIDESGAELLRRRESAPRAGYAQAIEAIAQFVLAVESELGARCTVGIGTPGAVSRTTGVLRNAYASALNGMPVRPDLERLLGREVRFANDANCFALSEAIDGAAKGAAIVFGAILGTGAGGGIVIGGQVLEGHNALAGEWGHTPLPWMTPQEHPGPACYCGRSGCIEQFVAGPALKRDVAQHGEEIANELHEDRLARAFSMVVNFLDPDVIVLGGGLSNIQRLYTTVPRLLPKYVYSQTVDTALVPAKHGDASGVRGAAMLWEPSAWRALS